VRVDSFFGILMAMVRHSTLAVLLWVLAVALLPIRMANAHLHLCLDGREQPVSLHVQDVPAHAGAEHAADEGHNDRDVDFSASLLTAKLAGGIDDAPSALLHVYVLAALLPIERPIVPVTDFRGTDFTSVVTLRPPVRGPPA
jgi:hypothetical protein